MNSDIRNTSCFLHVHRVKLRLALCESWYHKFSISQSDILCDGESSVCHDHVSRNQFVQEATVLS